MATATATFTTSRTQIIKGIKSIAKRGATLDADIGILAASAMGHAVEHGDVTLFGQLVDAMPRGARVKTLIAWVRSCAPINVKLNPAGACKVSVDKARERDEFHNDRSLWDIDTLKTTAWFEFGKGDKPETEFTAGQLLAMLEKIANGKKAGATEEAMSLAASLVMLAKTSTSTAPVETAETA